MINLNLVLILLLILVAAAILYQLDNKQENFGLFHQSPICKPFIDKYKTCYTFIQTIYNGGIEQTPDVKQCAEYCYVDGMKI